MTVIASSFASYNNSGAALVASCALFASCAERGRVLRATHGRESLPCWRAIVWRPTKDMAIYGWAEGGGGVC